MAPLRSLLHAAGALVAASLPAVRAGGSPAATSVASPAYFDYETQQLSDALVKSVLANSTIAASLFQSATNATNSSSITATNTTGCKVFPGDADWPSDEVWDAFDVLLGGSLIPTIPSASSCYTNWGDYSEAECDYVTEEWGVSWFQ